MMATIVMSDLHLGDSNHLHDTYWSTVYNLVEIFRFLRANYSVTGFNLVLNGDIVTGQGIFRDQIFRSVIQRGHWQVHLAAQIIKETVKLLSHEIPLRRIHVNKGTHDPMANNYAIFLTDKLGLDKATYHGREHVLNVAGDLGKCNILFTHGKGSSDYSPVSPSMTREINMRLHQIEIPVERVCLSHTHNLTVGLTKTSVTYDVTGGFQLYEPRLSRRPCGMILYLFCYDQLSVTPIYPDQTVVKQELADNLIEWKNIRYYASRLIQHAENRFV